MKTANRLNKHERTYLKIKQRILDGTYAPGDRLVLDALARELRVSPLPVREALRRLEAEGWVVYQRNVGARVAPLDLERWEAEMRVLAVLEGYATAMAMPHLRPADLRRLREILEAMQEALEAKDIQTYSSLNRQWHAAICERCPNKYLVQLLRETRERLDALRSTVLTYVPHRLHGSLEEHRRILELLEKGASPDEVEALARHHKLATIEAFLQTPYARHSDGEAQ
jgi:DNA-binding GntR family transcriptional regulator